MALLGAHRLRAIDQPARPDARATRRNAIEKTKPLGAPAAPRAYKYRPKAAVPEAPQRDDDPDIRRRRRRTGRAPSLCPAQLISPSAISSVAHANQGQIIDRAFHKAEN